MQEQLVHSEIPISESPQLHVPIQAELYATSLRERGLESAASSFERVLDISRDIQELGGKSLLVGGCVRDMVMGRDPKDLDIEVYALEAQKIEDVIKSYGKVSAVGRAFGILKVACADGVDLDISLPRSDSKIGEGHRGFEVKTDPTMSIEDAAKRRDFTMNSMSLDPLSGEVFDPYGGLEDIQDKTIRVTDPERFADDPLRVMRALQFAGRFGFRVDEESQDIMRSMVPSLSELPKERFCEEWKKLLLKSEQPSVGLELGMELGIFTQLYPEFSELKATPQDPRYHPEGDVWTHTKMVVDQAANIVRRDELDEQQGLILLLTALCHDIGKPETTEIHEDATVTAYGHEQVGVTKTASFLKRIGVDNQTTDAVLTLVDNHMWVHAAHGATSRGETISDGAFRKLAVRLHPATITQLAAISEADSCGSTGYLDLQNPGRLVLPQQLDEKEWLLSRADTIGVHKERPKNTIQGKDLINLGFTPGAEFSQIIRMANSLRDDLDYTDEQIHMALRERSSAADALSYLSSLHTTSV